MPICKLAIALVIYTSPGNVTAYRPDCIEAPSAVQPAGAPAEKDLKETGPSAIECRKDPKMKGCDLG